MLQEKIKKLHDFLLDILFPINCVSCGRGNEWLCKKCFSQIKKVQDQYCPVCEKVPTPDGKTCFSCKKKSSLDGLLVCASYKNKTVSKLIHYLKYRFIEDISTPLSRLIIRSVSNSSLIFPDAIIPIPLHPKRLRWRGFNQSLLLAEKISGEIAPGMQIPVLENILIRTKNTRSQMKIKNNKERMINIKNAFFVTNQKLVENKNILLIDDVATTGATISECAKILKKKGAKSVFAVVIARQEMKKI